MNHQTQRKIKSQKSAAIILIAGSFIIALSLLANNIFQLNHRNDIVIISASSIVGIFGIIGLRNSLRKLNKL